MAVGRLPDALRCNRDIGLHHPDWPARILRARDDLIEELDRMTGDADIAAMFDLALLRRRLVEFSAPDDSGIIFQTALPLAIAAGRFIAYAKGRNDI
jgi:hypothetical protein